jgi:hypothetical protein
LAVLRAEWSLLNRPERIERLAQKYLKLAPIQPRQLVTLDSVTDRDFTRPRVEVATTAPASAAATGQGAKPAAKAPAAAPAMADATTATPAAAAPWPAANVTAVQAAAQ